jgi:phosphatidylglycerophosphatase A
MDEIMGTKDNQSIVMDEVVGLGVTAWTAGHHTSTLIAAFVLFRAFDILKPPPVRQLDRWSKKKASQKGNASAAWWGGFGVMADDLLAGFEALTVIFILQQLGVLPA